MVGKCTIQIDPTVLKANPDLGLLEDIKRIIM